MLYFKLLLPISFFLNVLHSTAQTNYTQWVDPFIGTGGHGHTYPGATVPHGMVQLSPDTRLSGWDGCGGYHYLDSFIYGFSHTHLSGTGVSDYGDILLMPMQGEPSPLNTIYGSAFSHRKEKAGAGYYEVQLLDDDIFAAFTTTERTGYHQYRFSGSKPNQLILDLLHRDEVLASSISIEDSVTVSGMRRSKSWAKNQYVFFVMKFSAPFIKKGIWENDKLLPESTPQVTDSKNIKAYFTFSAIDAANLYVQIALSPVSVLGAKANLSSEALGKSFEEIRRAANEKWEKELSKIEVKSDDNSQLRIFYTALYHAAIVPCINMDVTNQYRGMDNQIHEAKDFTYYSVFSLWDTYRAAHPLYTLIDSARTLHYIKTFLAHFDEGGRLPVWELASNETDCMIGYHSVSVILDAYRKGINAFDTLKAWKAMQKSANWNHFGLTDYINKGVINTEDEHESVSKTLEYAYDDFCVASFGKAIGDSLQANRYVKRAMYYQNVLDASSGFMRARKNGGWLEPYDPAEVNSHFTEANSWQYSFYMPHDVDGYMKLIGGKNKLEQKLDQLFSASSQTTGRDQADITGLIGQYAHGNEPSHHIAYLYNHAGNSAKAQAMVRRLMNEMYHDSPDGLIGNEDCGQMSAWYVWSALGLYPVTPGTTQYVIGSPLFKLAEIHLGDDKSFVINAPNNLMQNPYIQEALLSTTASLRPKNLNKPFLEHQDIAGGGLVTLMMGPKPASCFTEPIPPALQAIGNNETLLINPIINGGSKSIKSGKWVRMETPQQGVRIFYSTDNSLPDVSSKRYKNPIWIDKSVTIKAMAVDGKGNKSFVTEASYLLVPHQWEVTLQSAYEKHYDGGGADGLIDGIKGSTQWRMGNWQGYQNVNPNLTIDLKTIQPISKVTMGLLQDVGSWIVMPAKIQVSVSANGKDYQLVYEGNSYMDIRDVTATRKDIIALFQKQPVRYIHINMEQYGKLPSWHEGAGGDTHIFVDEISVE